jgi:hypothetical protein
MHSVNRTMRSDLCVCHPRMIDAMLIVGRDVRILRLVVSHSIHTALQTKSDEGHSPRVNHTLSWLSPIVRLLCTPC